MNNVQAERLKQGLSIAAFSDKVAISETTLRRIEDPLDTTKVHVDTARQIASYFQTTVRAIFPDAGEITTVGGKPARSNPSEPRIYPACDDCHMEIPPAFAKCPE